MIIGACGVCCSVCRVYLSGDCAGCARGDNCSAEKIIESACPILRCAFSKQVPFCVRDCADYPCAFYQDRISNCERYEVAAPQITPANQILIPSPNLGLSPAKYTLNLTLNQKTHLYVFCLGSLRVFRNGAYITETEWGQTKGPTQKVKALFAYLLSRGNRGATKDALVELLWGDQPASEKGDGRLHAALYYLRRALEPNLTRRSESRYVRYEDGYYRLAPPNGYWVDALAFEEYYDQAQRLERDGKEDIAARFWKLAESLYQGDYMVDLAPCYTEDYIDDCCQWRRYRLKDMYVCVLLKLTRYYLRCNQDQLSLKYAQKALTEDSGSEEAHRLVMQLMHRAGSRQDLIRQYRLCERDIAKAEDRCPSPETVQLYHQLLQSTQPQ